MSNRNRAALLEPVLAAELAEDPEDARVDAALDVPAPLEAAARRRLARTATDESLAAEEAPGVRLLMRKDEDDPVADFTVAEARPLAAGEP
jgi:hypothetical protein